VERRRGQRRTGTTELGTRKKEGEVLETEMVGTKSGELKTEHRVLY